MPLEASIQASAQYISRNFKSDDIRNNRLSIQLRLDGFSFAQIDSLSNRILLLEEYKVPLMLGDEAEFQPEKVMLRFEKWLSEKKIPRNAYASLHILIDNSFFTQLPNALFLNTENLQDYLKLSHRLPANFTVKYNELPALESKNIFGLYAPLYFSLSDYFESFQLLHFSTVFIRRMALLQKTSQQKAVYVDVAETSMLVIVFDQDKLLFANMFDFKQGEDFIYFILLVYNQLGLHTEEVPLYFFGQIDRSSALYSIAYQYVKHIDFPAEKVAAVAAGSDMPMSVLSRYFTLTHAVLCE